jgi:hypothetical protein
MQEAEDAHPGVIVGRVGARRCKIVLQFRRLRPRNTGFWLSVGRADTAGETRPLPDSRDGCVTSFALCAYKIG